MLLALALAAGFVHPTPTPPLEVPVAAYQARRAKVMKALGGCAAVLSSQGSTNGITEDFRQDGDFYWLTGINEPGAWLEFAPASKFHKVILYLKTRDPEQERWTGPREAISPALKARYGVDQVRRGKPQLALEAAQSGCVAIIAPLASTDDADDTRADVALSNKAHEASGARVDYQRALLGNLRSAHTPEELERLERAISITRAGHEAAARATVAGVSERDVQTQIETAFYSNGATGLSYSSIVGSGENGAVLHWDQNSRLLRQGDLVVVDAAAEYGRYASDVTRTFPVSGKFSDEQAKAYRAVYQAQEDIFAQIHAGASMQDLQHAAEVSLEKSGYLENFIHGFGHFVGLDVHDAGDYERPIPAGAVITVEPGVYFPDRGFGIRIEDEVEVTQTGYRLLTRDFPRKLEDVEAWVMAARK